ncbi:MAG: DEAD/DEAH box helicase [Gemmatimonas sp.]
MNSPIKSPKWQRVLPSITCQQIAHVALSADNPIVHDRVDSSAQKELAPNLGPITLRDHQVDALLRLRTAIRQFGGALLADEVGLGKTYVALALAREYETVHILAPATLLPMWRSSIAIAECKNATIVSLHRLSREAISTQVTADRSLVIVDEAHHLRTRSTARYQNAVAFTAHRDVLLLTATPVHNRASELRALLALFLGQRVDALDNTTLAQCVIRRTANDAGAINIPSVLEHPPHRMPDNHMVLECLLTLPPPLPVHSGAAASALVRLGLLRAWCSSDAALSDSIRRRQLRGEALLHSLAHGRYPTQRELQSWIIGSDSVQLGFPELLVATASADTAEMLKTLLAHLDGLQSLLQLHTRTSIADARRTELLRSLVGTETLTMPLSPTRVERVETLDHNAPAPAAIVAFSQFASTVRSLHRALCDLSGIAMLTSEGGRIASGAIDRHELIASFAPTAHGRPPPRPQERIRLLITTDLLAEGVNLQDAGVVVHLDLPWTHALRQQRVGRLARMGAAHPIVHVHTFEPPMGADAILRVVAALERKAGLHREFVGENLRSSTESGAQALSGADAATELRAHWRRWCAAAPAIEEARHRAFKYSTVASVDANTNAWIAAISWQNETMVVAAHENERIGGDVTTLLNVVRDIDVALMDVSSISSDRLSKTPTVSIRRALQQLQRWLKTHALKESAGPMLRTLAPIQKAALDTLSSRFAMTSALSRTSIAPLLSIVEQSVLISRGAGAERALALWMSTSHTTSFAAWLAAFPAELTIELAPTHQDGSPHADHWHLIALLILSKRPDPHSSTH